MPTNVPSFVLPVDRLERKLADAKPTLTRAEAQAEAERCLYCHDAPCIKACPTEIDIPTFIKKIATDNVRGSAHTIFEANILGYSCARVCPVEVLCVGSCVFNDWHRPPIQIGKLQRYATEAALRSEESTGRPLYTPKPLGPRSVALIGAGPASLACAAYLRLEGVRPVILERGPLPGGLNTTGVAPYKLHSEDSLAEVAWVLGLGVELRPGVEVGKDVSGAELLQQFDAVFVGVGLGADSTLKAAGVEGPGVIGATALIQRLKNEAGFTLGNVQRAVIVGGGNTAIDVARELALVGVADVSMVYRKGAADMSGYVHELDAARREGVRLVLHGTPTEVLREADQALRGLRITESAGGLTPGATRDLPADLIVLAIGQSKLPEIAKQFDGVAVDARGCLVVDGSSRRTGNPKVWAGGDCINGGKEVVNAAADGREAARSMLAAFASL